jgi:hypothetical protein
MQSPFLGYDIAVGLVSIMIAVSGIILGLGIATDDKKLKDIGRSELVQAIVNGVIVGTLFFIFSDYGIIANISNFLVKSSSSIVCSGTANNYAICFAQQFLVGLSPITVNNAQYPTLFMSVTGLLAPITMLYGTLAFISSLSFNAVVVSISLASLFKPILTQLNYMITALSMSLLSLEAQSILLRFIDLTALPVLLPIGMVLRSFYFTRRLGGTILAVTIAFFAVLPLTYLLNAQLVAEYASNSNQSINGLVLNSTSVKSNLINDIQNSGINALSVSSISSSIESLLASAYGVLNKIFDYVALVIVEAFFLPIFSIMLTIVSARELARIFGSEVSFGRFDIF